jgi:hypothetical protein
MVSKTYFFRNHKKTIIVISILGFVMFSFANYIGFHHIPNHIDSLWRDCIYRFGERDNENNVVVLKHIPETYINSPDTVEVTQPPKYPLDSMLYIHNGKVEEDFKEELEELRKVDFSKLIVAEDKPTFKEAQYAIVRHYGEEVIKLLQKYDATFRIGKCYKAPLQNSRLNEREIARVTCMVSAFNKKNENLNNIGQPLTIVYDFVKYNSDSETWYVEAFSQRIPFDYELNVPNYVND